MNEKVGPYGLVPSLLVFAGIPKIPDISRYKSASQKTRLKAAKQHEKNMRKSIINRGIKKKEDTSAEFKPHIQYWRFHIR